MSWWNNSDSQRVGFGWIVMGISELFSEKEWVFTFPLLIHRMLCSTSLGLCWKRHSKVTASPSQQRRCLSGWMRTGTVSLQLPTKIGAKVAKKNKQTNKKRSTIESSTSSNQAHAGHRPEIVKFFERPRLFSFLCCLCVCVCMCVRSYCFGCFATTASTSLCSILRRRGADTGRSCKPCDRLSALYMAIYDSSASFLVLFLLYRPV